MFLFNRGFAQKADIQMYAVTNNLPTAMLTKKAKTSDVGSVVNLGGGAIS